MTELLLAEAIIADRRAHCLEHRYAQEWRQLSAIDKLGEKLRLRKNRLGLQGESLGSPYRRVSQP